MNTNRIGLPSLRSEDHEALVRITHTVSMPTAITLRRRFALDRLGAVELRHTDTGRDHGPLVFDAEAAFWAGMRAAADLFTGGGRGPSVSS